MNTPVNQSNLSVVQPNLAVTAIAAASSVAGQGPAAGDQTARAADQDDGDQPDHGSMEPFEDSGQVEIPPVLNMVTRGANTQWELLLHSKNCFECDGFNPSGTRRMARQVCRERENCPGNGSQIVVQIVGKRKKCLAMLTEAQAAGSMDLAKCIATMMAQVADGSMDEATLSWAMEEAGLTGASLPDAVEDEGNVQDSNVGYPSLPA